MYSLFSSIFSTVVVFRLYVPGNWLSQQMLREITLSVPNQEKGSTRSGAPYQSQLTIIA